VVSKEGSKKAWFWQYYTVKALNITWEKGTGRRKKAVLNELYTYKVNTKKYKFKRKALKLHSSTTRLSDHIELKHGIPKDRKAKDSPGRTPLTTWMNTAVKEVPDFKTSLVDWIVADC
jgi:hypothetical protein